MKKTIKFIIPIVIIVLIGLFMFNDKPPKLNFAQEHTAILAAIDQELELLDGIQNTPRVLSDALIGKISILSNKLIPIKLDDPSILTNRNLSPERGLLLTSLLEKKLSTPTYQKIFSITSFDHAFLDEVDLSNAPLERILLPKAFFRNVDLSGASLANANLFQVHFQNVNLRMADLRMANLREANLDGSNLTKANLASAYLREANLKGAQIENAILDKTNMAGVNLNLTAKGLGNNN